MMIVVSSLNIKHRKTSQEYVNHFLKSMYDKTTYDHVVILFVQGMRSKSQLGGQTLEQFTIEICDAFLSKVTYLKFKVY